MSKLTLYVDVHKKWKSFALDVSFSATQGCLGILGPSGCGKSMTLKSIAGIVGPDTGNITLSVDDQTQSLFDSSKKINVRPQKRHVGYLFQNYALFPNMNVVENIGVGLSEKSKEEKAKTIQAMISRFRLDGLEKHYPSQLSGGQQQRVALARIFAYEPKVLLLDEPFSAMDSFLKEGLRLELIQALNSYQGITIMVSHDRDEVYQLCDHLLLLDDGKVLQFGKTKEVFAHPETVSAARLTGCKNISRVQILDEHHVKALDWKDLILKTEKPVSKDVSAIGIRAHEFKASNDAGGSDNVIEVNNPMISEMPFEWYITLNNGLWWKVEKQLNTHDVVLPKYLKLAPSAIMLLKD